MKQLTEQQAIEIYNKKVYETWTHEQIVRFQLFQDRLCVPFDLFHMAMEKVLDRSVYTHEFAFRESLILEYLGEKASPTFEEIISLIPREKLIVCRL